MQLANATSTTNECTDDNMYVTLMVIILLVAGLMIMLLYILILRHLNGCLRSDNTMDSNYSLDAEGMDGNNASDWLTSANDDPSHPALHSWP